MKLAIPECVYNPSTNKWDIDLYFELEPGTCLDISDGEDNHIARICDVENFLAITEGIKAYYSRIKQDG